MIGLHTTVIEAAGSTSLVEVGNNLFLDSISSGTGPELKISGVAVVDGQYGAAWVPIGAEQTATGYDVAWKDTATDQFTVWSTDSSGNYIANIIGVVSGTDSGLESIETIFHQDLNGDGIIGNPTSQALKNTLVPDVTAAVTAGKDTFLFHAASETIWNTAKDNKFELDTLLSANNSSPPILALNDAHASQLHSLLQSADFIHANHDGMTEANPILADLHAAHFLLY